jgi:hypothetical protein
VRFSAAALEAAASAAARCVSSSNFQHAWITCSSATWQAVLREVQQWQHAGKQPHPAAALLFCCTAPAGCRLAYYGLATNFVTYLTHIMGVDAATAAIEVRRQCRQR